MLLLINSLFWTATISYLLHSCRLCSFSSCMKTRCQLPFEVRGLYQPPFHSCQLLEDASILNQSEKEGHKCSRTWMHTEITVRNFTKTSHNPKAEVRRLLQDATLRWAQGSFQANWGFTKQSSRTSYNHNRDIVAKHARWFIQWMSTSNICAPLYVNHTYTSHHQNALRAPLHPNTEFQLLEAIQAPGHPGYLFAIWKNNIKNIIIKK